MPKSSASGSIEVRVRDFAPSKNGFKFVNRFPGVPLPDALTSFIDTKNSAYGLCGGMCFSVIDHYKARKSIPDGGDIPVKESRLYNYLSRRQMASWGIMSTQVLRYVHWMGLSDEKAQADSCQSWEELKKRLDDDDLTVMGLVYNDFRETIRVWDNHQVLAYGYSEALNGLIQVHVYDPNHARRDDVSIRLRPVKVKVEGKEMRGMACTQVVGSKQTKDIHGFLVVPYEYDDPPELGAP